MTDDTTPVNTLAPLKNVSRFTEMVDRLVNRPPMLPGFGVFYGKAGLGKTCSSLYAINAFRGHYVECDDTWTRVAFCTQVLVEIGLLPPGAPMRMKLFEATAVIGNYFADNPSRPLFIDEADFLVKRRMIEVVRAIYKHCADAGASIILIGEDTMPGNLKMWERVDSRVLRFVHAMPLDMDDVRVLIKMICPDLEVEVALQERLRKVTGGSARRVVTKLHDLRECAAIKGLDRVCETDWNPAEDA